MADITQTQAMQDLSYLLGETAVPTTGVEDRQTFIQRALERVYRAYDFPMNKVIATVALAGGVATLPSNVHQDSSLDIRFIGAGVGADQVYRQIDYMDQDNYGPGTYAYWLTGYEGNYVLNTNETTANTLTLRYETTTPVISATISTPFPSSMALARGALIYYRQAEDPQADVAQEEYFFEQELNEVIAQYNRSRPMPRARTLHEVSGTYIGDISGNGAWNRRNSS